MLLFYHYKLQPSETVFNNSLRLLTIAANKAYDWSYHITLLYCPSAGQKPPYPPSTPLSFAPFHRRFGLLRGRFLSKYFCYITLVQHGYQWTVSAGPCRWWQTCWLAGLLNIRWWWRSLYSEFTTRLYAGALRDSYSKPTQGPVHAI